MKFIGKVRKFGENINTDEIIPARYLNTSEPIELAKHCMEDVDSEFVKIAKTGDVIIAGKNFGCGSSREHAPIAIKAFGISCVVGESFARIFFRNAINIGLPLIELKNASKYFANNDDIEIDLLKGVIKNLTKKRTFKISQLPIFMQNILKNGGLMNVLKEKNI